MPMPPADPTPTASLGPAAGRAETPSASGVAWDLGSLYDGPDDPRIEADSRGALEAALAFAGRTRERVASLAPAALAAAIAEYEAIEERGRRPSFYASLLFAADTSDEAAKRLADSTREAWVEVVNELTFFELEVKDIPDERYTALAAAPELADCRHWMDGLRRLRPHTLSEAEERVINQKNLTGRDALSRLFDELSAALRFRIRVDGAERELSANDALSLLYEPDRDLRERAFSAMLDGFAAHEIALTGIFDALVHDHRLDCELRRFPDAITPTHLDNEVRPETVQAMMAATERHYDQAQEYFRLKARLLGVSPLKNTDLYAPLGAAPAKISFDAARTLVLEAFAEFDPSFARLATEFFTRRWVDAEPRPGKRLGAFCASLAPSANPYVLLSYTDTPRDVATLAHELGHGVHDRLAARQRPINYQPPLTLAETASTFAEIVLTRALLRREPDPALRRDLLCAKLEDTIATVFRQNVLTRFELAAHAARQEAPLTARTLCELWWTENARLYGDAVEMIPAYRWGWTYIPHFIHSRFYCYAYVFGELLVLALYRQYEEEGRAFVPRYLELLAAADSEPPDVLLRRLGIEIDDPAFWDRGFAVIASLLEELRATLAAI
jgi:oligoendopeptidase F